MATVLTVSTRELSAREAWNMALEHRYCRVTFGAVQCLECGERFGLACSPAVIAQHLETVHGIVDLNA